MCTALGGVATGEDKRLWFCVSKGFFDGAVDVGFSCARIAFVGKIAAADGITDIGLVDALRNGVDGKG